MTTLPPVPQAAQSPYPLQPPPMSDDAPEAAAHANEDGHDTGEDDPSGSTPRWPRFGHAGAGIGAAIGIGSAALVAALLYSRRKSDATSRPAAVKPARTRKAPSRSA